MSVRTTHVANDGSIQFITFTCFQWRPLIDRVAAYDLVYKWFDYLKTKDASVVGHVIMPNHVHVLLHFKVMFKPINIVVGNAKRFLAYGIIERLQQQGANHVLEELADAVDKQEGKKGQLHRVFEESFDCKECFTENFLVQKLDYMHHNPMSGKWNLVADFALYPHSSAGYYEGTGAHAYEKILHFRDLL